MKRDFLQSPRFGERFKMIVLSERFTGQTSNKVLVFHWPSSHRFFLPLLNFFSLSIFLEVFFFCVGKSPMMKYTIWQKFQPYRMVDLGKRIKDKQKGIFRLNVLGYESNASLDSMSRFYGTCKLTVEIINIMKSAVAKQFIVNLYTR